MHNRLRPLPHFSADVAALGLGAVHCINAESQRYRARKQRNSAGAEKWMDVRMWDAAASCISNAKASGYRVIATHFDSDAVTIHEVDWTQPTAIILGNEREGRQLVTGSTMLQVNAVCSMAWLVACMQLVWHGVAQLHHTHYVFFRSSSVNVGLHAHLKLK